MSYRRENSLPAPYESYQSSSNHTSSRRTGSSRHMNRNPELMQISEGRYIGRDGQQPHSSYRDRNHRHDLQNNYCTYDGMNESTRTLPVGSNSSLHSMQRVRPNQNRQAERQSKYINSAEAGYKVYGGFIGPHNQMFP